MRLNVHRFGTPGGPPLVAIHGVTVLAHVVKLLNSSIIRHAYAIAIAAPAYLSLAVLIAGVLRHQARLRRSGADLDWSRDETS